MAGLPLWIRFDSELLSNHTKAFIEWIWILNKATASHMTPWTSICERYQHHLSGFDAFSEEYVSKDFSTLDGTH
jgi:hypothetical protein